MAVTGQMRVADVAGALDWLNAQPFVRKNDIGLIGHSHGGWTTMRAVQGNFGLAQRGLRAAVAYYPSCSAQFDRNVSVPLLILIGDKDDWTPAENCRRLQAAGFAHPELVRRSTIPTPITASTRSWAIAPSPWPTARAIAWSTMPWPRAMPRRARRPSSTNT